MYRDKLDSRIEPSGGVSPDTDQEVHRYQHDFPKDIKQKQVQRDEYTYHSHLKEQ